MAEGSKRTVVVLRERWWESVINDSYMLGALVLCFWITKESLVWSVVVAVLFMTTGVSWMSDMSRFGVYRFKSMREVFKWAGEHVIEELEKAKEVKE